MGSATCSHGFFTCVLEHTIGDVTAVVTPLVVPEGISYVALELGWL